MPADKDILDDELVRRVARLSERIDSLRGHL